MSDIGILNGPLAIALVLLVLGSPGIPIGGIASGALASARWPAGGVAAGLGLLLSPTICEHAIVAPAATIQHISPFARIACAR
jgi:hypothetical protein